MDNLCIVQWRPWGADDDEVLVYRGPKLPDEEVAKLILAAGGDSFDAGMHEDDRLILVRNEEITELAPSLDEALASYYGNVEVSP